MPKEKIFESPISLEEKLIQISKTFTVRPNYNNRNLVKDLARLTENSESDIENAWYSLYGEKIVSSS